MINGNSARAMHDFAETMERIRAMQGMTKEQIDRIAQAILAMADVPAEEMTGEIISNEQACPER